MSVRAVDAPPQAGVKYFIVVDGYSGACGDYILSVSCNSACPRFQGQATWSATFQEALAPAMVCHRPRAKLKAADQTLLPAPASSRLCCTCHATPVEAAMQKCLLVRALAPAPHSPVPCPCRPAQAPHSSLMLAQPLGEGLRQTPAHHPSAAQCALHSTKQALLLPACLLALGQSQASSKLSRGPLECCWATVQELHGHMCHPLPTMPLRA